MSSYALKGQAFLAFICPPRHLYRISTMMAFAHVFCQTRAVVFGVYVSPLSIPILPTNQHGIGNLQLLPCQLL